MNDTTFLQQIWQRLENHKAECINIVYTHIVVNYDVFMALLKETGYYFYLNPKLQCELRLWGLKVVINPMLKANEHFVLVDSHDPITNQFLKW